MSKYTLQIHGDPLDDAVVALDAVDGVKAPGATEWARSPADVLSVTVDAPTMEAAQGRVREALPEQGSYTVERPEPLEDEEED